MIKLVNLTPHDVTLVNSEGEQVAVIPPSGEELRAEVSRRHVHTIWVGDTVVKVNYVSVGAISASPPRVPGTMYIVSRMAAEAMASTGRTDILIPDDTVRDEDGKIVGCRSLATLVLEQ